MFKSIITSLLLLPLGVSQKLETNKSPFNLKLNQETLLTDNYGVLLPAAIIPLHPATYIKIYLTDGTELTGIVKEAQYLEVKDGISAFRVFGDILNKENTGFGFVITETGVFGGAVVFRNTDTTYTVSYSEAHKGFVLQLNTQTKKAI